MIKLLTSMLFLVFVVNAGMAQETVSAEQGYAKEVYYNLQTGIVGTANAADWDIAFEVAPGFTAAVIVNGGIGVQLYDVPNKGIEDFGTAIDTTGMLDGWVQWYNSTQTWTHGAFNMDADPLDAEFGWGSYSVVTHFVTGTTLFVVVLPDGTTKQIAIDKLASGVYTASIADLDGSNSKEITIDKDDYLGKLYAYYSIEDDNALDLEPQLGSWDLVFSKYIDFVGPNNDIPYGVFGIRSAPGVKVAEVESSMPADVNPPSDSNAYGSAINVIGSDWKTFTGTGWSLSEVAYFVKALDDRIYRIVFADFGGSSTGTTTFNVEDVTTSSVDNGLDQRIAQLGLYPNIVSKGGSVSLVYDLVSSVDRVSMSVVNSAGQVVHNDDLSPRSGFYDNRVDVSGELAAGRYFVVVDIDGIVTSLPLIVE